MKFCSLNFYAIFFIQSLLVAFSQHAFSDIDHEHKSWNEVLAKHVVDGLVSYDKLAKDRAALDAYVSSINSVKESEFELWTVTQQKAFLINAYNAYTVRLIVDHPGVSGIRDIAGWRKMITNTWNMEFDFIRLFSGKVKTLDPIEKEYLLKRSHLKDKRVHAAVNCASISCPVLRNEAYVSSKLDSQLDDAVRVWLSDKSKNDFSGLPKVLSLSKIFSWYSSDFGSRAENMEFLKKFGPPEAAVLTRESDPKIKYLEYNWGLNGRR